MTNTAHVSFKKGLRMDNNKNRQKDRPKSDPELRKMKPRENADLGIVEGKKTGTHESKHEK